MDGHVIPWEQWLALLRRIAYNVTVGWITGKPMPLHFSFEIAGRCVLVMGEVRVEPHPLILPDNASEDVPVAVDAGAALAKHDIATAAMAAGVEVGNNAGA